MKLFVFSLLFLVETAAPVTVTIEDHKIFRFCENGFFNKPGDGEKMILEFIQNYETMIWSALRPRDGFSFFLHTLGVNQIQFRNFVLDFLIKRCSYGCRESLIILESYLSGYECEIVHSFDVVDKIEKILRYLYKNPIVEYKEISSKMSCDELKKVEEFHLFNFLTIRDVEERTLIRLQEILWNRIIQNEFSNISERGKKILPYLNNVEWLKGKTFDEYPKVIKICLQEDAREMLELYCGVRFSSEFAGSPEPLEDIFVPGIFRSFTTTAMSAFTTTQITASTTVNCLMDFFRPSGVSAPEAQAFLVKKKQ